MANTIQLNDENDCSVAFCASTGRTATMFVAKTLNTLPNVKALHEGCLLDGESSPQLPLINFHNRKAWNDTDYAVKIADTLRSKSIVSEAAGGAALLVDVAFNNAPFFEAFSKQHPSSSFVAIFRRCEGFLRSATIVCGEDTQPAGWPSRDKPLTDREKFISIGRLKPSEASEYYEMWDEWSAIQRNIWLWHKVNTHLADFVRTGGARRKLLYEDLVEKPADFWGPFLDTLGVNSEANLKQCVEMSKTKTNQRASYQIGPVSKWSNAEQALYEKLALPLEDWIYGRRFA